MPLFRNAEDGGYFVAGLGELHLKALLRLTGLNLAVAQKPGTADALLEVRVLLCQRLDEKLAVLGPSHSGDVEVFLGLVETYVARVHTVVLTLVEALRVYLDILLCHRTFAELHPGARAEDALAVLRHPCLQFVEEGSSLLVIGAVGTKRYVEQQVAVLGDDVHKLLHEVGGGAVAALVGACVVVPVADAVARLPGELHHLVGGTALHIPRESLLLVVVEYLAEDHAARVPVVDVGGNLEAAVAQGIEGEHRDIEIDEVGIVAVDGIDGAVEEVGDELRRGRAGSAAPVPLAVYGAVVPRTLAHGVLLLIEHLRVETFPPLALAVLLAEVAVVVDTHLVALHIKALGGFEPRPRMVGMERDAQRQSHLLGGSGPLGEDVALGTDVHRVPGLVLGVPQVVVVVVVAQHEEILCSAAFVALHESHGIPFLGLEEWQDVLVAELGGVAVVVAVVLILMGALLIEAACHPVAAALDTLCAPMRPDAELGIAEPLGRLVLLERLPCGFVLTGHHLLVLFADGYPVAVLRTQGGSHKKENGKDSCFHRRVNFVFFIAKIQNLVHFGFARAHLFC